MRLTTVLLLVATLHVSARSDGQTISLQAQNMPLETAISRIKQQTGFLFIYNDKDMARTRPVTLDVRNATLPIVLDMLFHDQPLTYEIQANTVFIITRPQTVSSPTPAAGPPIDVHGRITDEKGEPLVGATVTLKGTQKATRTDKNGEFAITVPDNGALLIFSFVGFENQELAAKDIPNGSVIRLKAAETNLKQVVVNKGYYDEKRELLTGNVTTVLAKVIGDQPVSDPILALEGRVPGLLITQTSGMPGASYTIRLRGQNSLFNGNDPLYIVDGVPFSPQSVSDPFISGLSALGSGDLTPGQGSARGLSPFNGLNPADIESIEVLKDADATAIYGSRGANGVMLITTKKGKPGQTRIDIDVNSGIGSIAHMLSFLNTQQYLAMRREAFRNDGIIAIPANDYDINGAWDTTRYTDWQKVLIGNPAHFTNANLSISGGTINTQYKLGGSYSRQTTVFPGDFHDQKANAHFSLNNTSSNKKFHASFAAQYNIDNNLVPNTDPTSILRQLAPDAPALYSADGSINWQNGTWYNPMAYTLATAQSNVNSLIGDLNLGYELLPGLKIHSNFGYTYSDTYQTNQIPATGSYGPPLNSNRINWYGTSERNTWLIEPQISYERKISKGELQLQVGGRAQQDVWQAVGYNTSGYTSDALLKNTANASFISVNGSFYSDYRSEAVFGRVNYSWDDKYVINITGSRDGSSRFGPANRFGNFGSVGVAWNFYKEEFIYKALPFLSSGKLRGSYGTTGNDHILDYQYLSTYSASGNYQGTPGLKPNRLASPYFAWEVVNKLEVGLELGVTDDRVRLDIDYYRNRSGNQLVGQPLPNQDGFGSIQANLPAVVQNSGLEAVLTTENIKGALNWTTSFNISVQRDKLVSFPGLASNPSYSDAYVVGQPITLQPRLHYTGLDPQTGIYTFQDLDGDGFYTGSDRRFLKKVTVDYFGGMLNNFSYKGWQLSFLLQFMKQTGLGVIGSLRLPGSVNANQPTFVLDRWQKPGDQTNIGKFSTGVGAGSATATAYYRLYQTDYVVTDASFVRLKNVSLSYTLPKSWLHRLGLQNLVVYAQAQNLLTFTGYKGYDPETQGISLPPLRMTTAGIRMYF